MTRTLLILTILCASTAVQAQDGTPAPAGRTIVFVPGAFGGGWSYKPLQQMLAAEGREAYRVTLTGLGERKHLGGPEVNLDTHIMDVINVLEYEELTDVILVGHSYGGMVITGVAHRVPERIGHLVYLDAFLPEDGESALSLFSAEGRAKVLKAVEENGEGWKWYPWWQGWEDAKLGPHPFGTYKQPVKLGNPAAAKIPSTYVAAIGEDGSRVAPLFSIFHQRAKERGWDYYEWKTEHGIVHTVPERVVTLLLGLE